MINRSRCFLAVFLAAGIMTPEVWSRGMPGGGGRSAGGMSRGGGGGAGGSGRSMPSMSRSSGSRSAPSMSRSQASRPSPSARPSTRPSNINRPNNLSRPSNPNISSGGAASRPSGYRPAAGTSRPNGNRPTTGGSLPSASRPGSGSSRPNLSGRPSGGELGDFLGLPGGNASRPSTLPGRTPGASSRPNLSNRPSTLPATRPDFGSKPDFSNRPNLGNRPNNGNRPDVRPGVGNGNQVNLGNRVNIDRDKNINSIRNHWNQPGHRPPFHNDWNGRYPPNRPGWGWHGGWGRYPGNWYWRHGSWATVGTWFLWSWNDPVVYDYGTNVVYRDNYVYVDDQQVGSAEQYYQQATTIAESIPAEVTEEIEWMPLGVFAIAEQGGVDNGMLIQLAVTKEGYLAGTFYNDATDEGRPVEGQVDKESQRAAWKFSDGKNSEIVMETAVYNLTQEESTALVHYGEEKTETWLMVRLPESDESNPTDESE